MTLFIRLEQFVNILSMKCSMQWMEVHSSLTYIHASNICFNVAMNICV